MRIAGIINNSVVNGPGIRDVIFVQGCQHHCPRCHNPETWNKEGGLNFTVTELLRLLEDSNNDVTISGGEPLDQYHDVLKLVRCLNTIQHKKIWLYTGYTYEEIPRSWLTQLQSCGVEVIVDGEYIEHLKDLRLQFRGSSNQRLIDLTKSVTNGKVVLWEDKT